MDREGRGNRPLLRLQGWGRECGTPLASWCSNSPAPGWGAEGEIITSQGSARETEAQSSYSRRSGAFFSRSTAGPWFFSEGNKGRKQSLALDLGLGLRFHPPPTLRYPCSFLLQEGKRLKCLPNAGTGRQIETGWSLKSPKIAHFGHLLCCYQHPLTGEF